MHIGSVHNKIEDYLPPEFCLPRSSRGNFLKVPSAGLVSDISEDQDQQQDHVEKSSHQIRPEDSAVGLPILIVDVTTVATAEDGGSLFQNPPQEGGFESVLTVSDSDE